MTDTVFAEEDGTIVPYQTIERTATSLKVRLFAPALDSSNDKAYYMIWGGNAQKHHIAPHKESTSDGHHYTGACVGQYANGTMVCSSIFNDSANPIDLYKCESTDGGQTWSAHTLWLEAGAGVNYYAGGFLTDGSRTWFFYYEIPSSTDYTDCELWSTYTDNNGSSWSTPSCIWNSGGSVAGEDFYACGQPVLLSDGNYIIPYWYSDTPSSFNGYLVQTCLISDDDGATWAKGGIMDLTGSSIGLVEGSMVEHANGDISIWMRDQSATSGGYIFYSLSDDGGATWATPERCSLKSPRAIFAAGKFSNGDFFIIWHNEFATDNGNREWLYIAVSEDEAASWKTATLIIDSGTANEQYSNCVGVLVTPNDRVVMALGHRYISPNRTNLDIIIFDKDYALGNVSWGGYRHNNIQMMHPLDGASDAACDDLTDNRNDIKTASTSGTPAYEQTGPIHKSILFTAADTDALFVNSVDELNMDGDFTVAFPFKTSNTATLMYMLAKRESSGAYAGYMFYTSAANTIYFIVDYGAGAAILESATGFRDGAWHWIVGTRSGTTTKLYIDGSEEDTDTTAGADADISNTTDLAIGRRSIAAQYYFDGYIGGDMIVVKGEAWSANEVLTRWNNMDKFLVNEASGFWKNGALYVPDGFNC